MCCEPGFVHWCALKSVTDRLYCRYRADTDVKWIKLSACNYVLCLMFNDMCGHVQCMYFCTMFNVQWSVWSCSVYDIMYCVQCSMICVAMFSATEVYLARRPTGYIPTLANANFASGSDAVRGHMKVLYPATRWSRGRNPFGRNAMKTRETWNTDGSLWCLTF